MVVVIEPSHPHVESTVQYNENKMNGEEGMHTREELFREDVEDGHVVATRNVPEGSTLEKEFEKNHIRHIKHKKSGQTIKNISFHMSVNPAETEKDISEEKMTAIIDDIMSALGYADNPYRIYKHTDIERKHYHVVSTRIDKDGKKIDSSFEYLKLQKTLDILSKKYNYAFAIGDEKKAIDEKKASEQEQEQEPTLFPAEAPKADTRDDEEEKKKKEKKEKEKKVVPGFTRKNKVPVMEQIRNAHDDVMENWSFTTFEQYQALLLRRYNILVELEKPEENVHVVYSGMNEKGKQATVPLREKDLERNDMLSSVKEKCSKTKMSMKKEQRARLEALANAAAERSETFKDYRDLMEKKGVYVVLSWTKDGDLFGVTWIDRATKCAWKGSETNVDLKWLRETISKKGWEVKPSYFETYVKKKKNMPSRVEDVQIYREKDTKPKGGDDEARKKKTSGKTVNIGKGRPINFGHGQHVETGGHKKKDDLWEDETEKLNRNIEM